jgi:hypothetical protein
MAEYESRYHGEKAATVTQFKIVVENILTATWLTRSISGVIVGEAIPTKKPGRCEICHQISYRDFGRDVLTIKPPVWKCCGWAEGW